MSKTPEIAPAKNRETIVSLKAEIAALRERLDQAGSIRAQLDAKNTALEADNNRLRDMVMDLSLDGERMRGYMQALEDAKPPIMVPEQRIAQWGNPGGVRDPYRDMADTISGRSHLSAGYGLDAKPRRWYHK